ncbi:hypothetical protein [Phaffia rhodozyma]|uniref:Uncharacterized protein n=1 Tax=Phaffia rhodozyma TaxID=264483 RepID=A0A0F7SLQ3_PHARH|nr:hypothetical protein [Phaffia rhodozyma]
MPNTLVPNRFRFPVVLPPKGSPFDPSVFNPASHVSLDIPACVTHAIPVTLPVRPLSAQHPTPLITTNQARTTPSSSSSASSSASSTPPSSLGGTSNLHLILSQCLLKTAKADLENNRHIPPSYIPYAPLPQPKLFPSGPAVQLVIGKETSHSGPLGAFSNTARETRRSKAHKRKSGSFSPEREQPTAGPFRRASASGSRSNSVALTVDESSSSTVDRKRRRKSTDQTLFATSQPRPRPSKALVSASLPIVKPSSLAPTFSPATSNKKMRKSMSTAGFSQATFRPISPSIEPIAPSVSNDSSPLDHSQQAPCPPTTSTFSTEPGAPSVTTSTDASTGSLPGPPHVVILNGNNPHIAKHREKFKSWVPSPLSNSLLPQPSSSPPAAASSTLSPAINASTSDTTVLNRSPTGAEKAYKPIMGKPSLMTFHTISQVASCPRVPEEYLTSSQSTRGSSALTA